MLKLTKYELIKSKMTLIIIALIFALLEGYFLYSIIIEDAEHTGASAGFLALFAMCCFFVVYVMAIVNYSKELSSKSSYLIFMTPNTPLSIILSKMLSVFIIGACIVAVIAIFATIDIQLVLSTYESTENILDFFKYFLESMEVDTVLLLPTILGYILEFLINFFAIVTMIYLAITLSSTVLQNKKGKGIVSFILVIVFALLMAKIEEQLPILYKYPDNAAQAVLNILPTAIFEFIIMVACIFGSAKLLEKKVSL